MVLTLRLGGAQVVTSGAEEREYSLQFITHVETECLRVWLNSGRRNLKEMCRMIPYKGRSWWRLAGDFLRHGRECEVRKNFEVTMDELIEQLKRA